VAPKKIKSAINFEQVHELYFQDLLLFANMNFSIPGKARLIVEDNLAKLENVLENYSNVEEIKVRLFLLVYQDCFEWRQKIDAMYKGNIEQHYSQVVFYLEFFLGKTKAQQVTKRAIREVTEQSIFPNRIPDVGIEIKRRVLNICQKEFESAGG
jgi:hypothetical protein